MIREASLAFEKCRLCLWLTDRDRAELTIVDDSISEQLLYSIETYLLASNPDPEIQTSQFGWGVSGLLGPRSDGG